MAPGAVGQHGTAAAATATQGGGAWLDPLPEQWTASTATIAATLVALKESMVGPTTPRAPEPVKRAVASPADLPPLPTRRTLREAEHGGQAPSPRSRTSLFTRLLTVRAFRTRHARARAASAPVAAVGAILDAAAVHGVLTLHRRRVPGQRGRLEHLAVSASGVHVVDVKHFKNAAIEVRPAGGAGGSVDLVVGGRVMTAAATATARRVAAVRASLAAAGLEEVPVTGALCFVDGLLPLGVSDLEVGGVHVLRPSGLTALVTRGGPLHAGHLRTIEEHLAGQFPDCG